jgi:hypothetical protein
VRRSRELGTGDESCAPPYRVTAGRLAASGGLLGLALIGSPVPVAAQVHTSSEERFFRIEWRLERGDERTPAIVGSVNNHYLYPIQRVQLQVQVLDEAGQITHETLGTISDVPPGGRGDFRLQLPATGARYVVRVHSFEFGAGQSP